MSETEAKKPARVKTIFRPWEGKGEDLSPGTCRIEGKVFDLTGFSDEVKAMLLVDGFTRLAREGSSEVGASVGDRAAAVFSACQDGTLHARAEGGGGGSTDRAEILVRFFADPKAVAQTRELTTAETAAIWDTWDKDMRKKVQGHVRYKFHRDEVALEKLKARKAASGKAESETLDL